MTIERRAIGASGLEASVIGVGTWAIGGTEWGGADRQAAVAGLRSALDAGINLIDTAPIYGYGLAEDVVGEAIRGRRDEVIVATKCGLVWNEAGGEFFFANERGEVRRHLGAGTIPRQVEASLRRLGIETIDLCQTHWQDSTTPIEETMEALLRLARAGKIRVIGVSNVTSDQLSAYAAAGPVACVQESFSMLDRSRADDLFPLCGRLGVGILAYSPLAMGLLSGRVTAERRFAPGDVRGQSALFHPDFVARVNAFLDSVRPIAARRNATLAQLVLAWTLGCGSVTHVLTGVRNAAQAEENAGAAALALSAAEISEISARLDAAALRAPSLYG